MSWTLSNLSSLSVEGAMTLLPFEKLEFCTNPDGSLQSLGAGSFGTVSPVNSCLDNFWSG